MADELPRRRILTETWSTEQEATIDEVTFKNGRIKYVLQARNAGRTKPYVEQIFGKLEQAEDFLYRKLMGKEVRR